MFPDPGKVVLAANASGPLIFVTLVRFGFASKPKPTRLAAPDRVKL